MHKIAEKEFTIEDFSCEHLIDTCLLESVINELNIYRDIYNNYDEQTDNYKKEFSKKDIWWQMIQLLPSSYNQRRTIMFNYEVLANIYKYRKDHKLDEWRELCKWIETLPYSEIITGKTESKIDDSANIYSAYEALNEVSNKNDINSLRAAIQEAIGYLGEVLDD